MTKIQELCVEHILNHKDIIAKAHTGSGKTLAFAIGATLCVDVKSTLPSVLVLAPTRELCDQVASEIKKVAKVVPNTKVLTLYAGVSYSAQKASLTHSSHILVATPARVLKHLKDGILTLKNLKMLVLDEVDKMLDMGFLEEIEELKSYITQSVQTLAFSATLDDATKALALSFTKDALLIEVETKPKKLQEIFIKATTNKTDMLIKLLCNYDITQALVFVNTKLEATALTKRLHKKGIDALEFHGDLEQYQRHDALVQFQNKSTPLLICSDAASRGLDIKELKYVINYDQAPNEATHKHRIGRTARMDESGVALTLVNDEFDGKTIDPSTLKECKDFTLLPSYNTFVIEGGKKDKLRPLDIVGVLTKALGFSVDDIGKIDIYDRQSYVAIKAYIADEVFGKLKLTTIKAKKFTIWRF